MRPAPIRTIFVVAALALSTMGCKLKLEGKVTGVKPDSDDTVIVHVVSEKGAELKCSSDACATTKVPDTGEVDLEVKLPSGSSKSVFVSGKKGLKKKQIYVDLSAGTPPTLTVKNGSISCVPEGCKGTLTVAPSPEVLIEAAAGTLVEIEGEKVKVPEGGSATLAFPSPLSPPLEKQPLAKVCAGYVSSTKASPILGSTTLSLTFPDGRKSTAKIDIDAHLVEIGLSKGLAEIENGPVVFPWEKAGTPARGKRAGVYVNGDYCFDAGAAGATVADLDTVATSEPRDARESECHYQVTDGTIRTARIKMHDHDATAYDRVTGKKLASRRFLAPKDCDETITVKRDEFLLNEQSAHVNDDAIGRWAATFAR